MSISNALSSPLCPVYLRTQVPEISAAHMDVAKRNVNNEERKIILRMTVSFLLRVLKSQVAVPSQNVTGKRK
jgi:hypothetical protein